MEFKEDQLVKWLKLTKVPKLGPSKILKLFNLESDIERIFSLSDEQLLQTRLFNEQMILDFSQLKRASDDNFIRAIKECKENNIQVLTILSDAYPSYLKNIPYPPLTLFLKGNLELLYKNKVAVVGSRNADENAKNWTYNLSKKLVENNLVIVSGGAVGIDYAAHRGALDAKGNTICVLGSGFFRMFPEKHIELFKEIERQGLLISEHLPNFPGSTIALVQRNRITSGISNGLVMVASGEKGGAMIQTKMAFEQRIPIFYPKEELNLQPNEGVIQIKKDWAGIEIESVEDIIKKLIIRPEIRTES